jgi:hypothetical protein
MQTQINKQERATPGRSLPVFLSTPTTAQLNALTLTLDDLSVGSSIKPEWLAAGFESPITSFQNWGNSIYHGLATELTRRFSNGLQLKAAYTWSHAIDDSTADLFATILSPRRAQSFNDRQAERASSALDRRHRLTATWYYESQWLNGHSNWAMKNLAGNWILSGTYTAESPEMATVQSGLDANLNGDTAGDRAVINVAGLDGVGSPVTALTNSAGAIVGYLATNPNARYIAAAAGVYPNAGRNTIPMKGINNWDFTMVKKFTVLEGKTLQFTGTFYNLFNHPQFAPGAISSALASGTDAVSRAFLNPALPAFFDSTQYFDSHPRSITLGMRFQF